VIKVRVWIEQRGAGDLSWVVLVGDTVMFSGRTRTDALRERWRLWCDQPEQRAVARERIAGEFFD
jgi:hypothetical protein